MNKEIKKIENELRKSIVLKQIIFIYIWLDDLFNKTNYHIIFSQLYMAKKFNIKEIYIKNNISERTLFNYRCKFVEYYKRLIN